MTKFFSSDLHFYHRNVIKYCNRPFEPTKEGVQEMNDYLIKKHNELVKPEDTWYFLGDFGFAGNKQLREIIAKLNGKKIAICGNHDRGATKMVDLGFDFACYEMVLNIGGHRCRLSHFPYRPTEEEIEALGYDDRHLDKRPPRIPGEFLLHGHSHSSKDKILKPWALDIGVDGHNYKPWNEHEITSVITKWKNENLPNMQLATT